MPRVPLVWNKDWWEECLLWHFPRDKSKCSVMEGNIHSFRWHNMMIKVSSWSTPVWAPLGNASHRKGNNCFLICSLSTAAIEVVAFFILSCLDGRLNIYTMIPCSWKWWPLCVLGLKPWQAFGYLNTAPRGVYIRIGTGVPPDPSPNSPTNISLQ